MHSQHRDFGGFFFFVILCPEPPEVLVFLVFSFSNGGSGSAGGVEEDLGKLRHSRAPRAAFPRLAGNITESMSLTNKF